MPTKTTSPDLAAEVAFLTRALKAPTLRDSVDRLAERARAETWSHEEFLVACLQREVCAGVPRRRAASAQPASPPASRWRRSTFDHARGLKRDVIAHLGTPDFITARDNVVFLGLPGTGKLTKLGRYPLFVVDEVGAGRDRGRE